jgi:hypothetical protein
MKHASMITGNHPLVQAGESAAWREEALRVPGIPASALPTNAPLRSPGLIEISDTLLWQPNAAAAFRSWRLRWQNALATFGSWRLRWQNAVATFGSWRLRQRNAVATFGSWSLRQQNAVTAFGSRRLRQWNAVATFGLRRLQWRNVATFWRNRPLRRPIWPGGGGLWS